MCEVILILSKQLMRGKRQRRLSQVMDEFSISNPDDIELEGDVVVAAAAAPEDHHPNIVPAEQHQGNENRGGAAAPKFLWRLMKAPVAVLGSLFGLGSDHYLSDYFDSMGTGDALRDARMRVWLRQDPTLADRHYLMVQSGMRYSFFLY